MTINNSVTEFYRILSKTVSDRLKNLVEFDKVISSVDYPRAREFEFITYINITGSFTGTLFLFATKDSLNFIFENIYAATYSKLKEEDLVQDSMDEFLNLIIANSTEAFSKDNIPINIGVPRQQNEEAALNILAQLESGVLLNTPQGKLLLTFVKK